MAELDINILNDLYRHRILTTDQITLKHFNGRENRSYVYRKMHILREKGYIRSFPVLNEKGQKSTAGHYITDKGISVLAEKQMITGRMKKAKDLRVQKSRLYYLVETNQLIIELEPYGWKAKDSREVKEKYRINRGDLIQGELTNVEGRNYGFYYLSKNTPEKTVVNVIKQIKRINNEDLQNIIIFLNGEQVFDTFYQKQEELELIIGGELLLLPYKFGIKYLQHFPTEHHFVNFITKKYGTLTKIDHPIFKRILNINGEEKYFVNLLTNDAMELFNIKRYTVDKYHQYKRNLVTLVPSPFFERYHDMFKLQPHIEIVPVDTNLLFERSPNHA